MKSIALFAALFLCACASHGVTQSQGNLVANPAFETGKPMPYAWILDQALQGKGTVTTVDLKGKGRVLRLTPNSTNTDSTKLLGIGQLIDVDQLQGKKLYVRVEMSASKGGKALFAVISVGAKNVLTPLTFLVCDTDEEGLQPFDAIVKVPTEGQVTKLIVACAVEGTKGWADFDNVQLTTKVPDHVRKPMFDPGPPLVVTAKIFPDQVIRKIPRTVYGTNTEWIWDGKGLWDPKAKRLRPDVVALTNALGPTIIRWPGGTFSDFYHWQKAVGPQSERPSTPSELAGDNIRHSVGTPEILDFARQTNCQLIFTANAGSGTAEEAADWVRYTNKSGRTPRVDFWEIGNEIYLSDDSQGTKSVTKTAEQYADIADRFADAIRKADPAVKIGAILDESYTHQRVYAEWPETVLRKVGSKIDFVAVHNAYSPIATMDTGKSLREIYAATLATPVLIKKNLDLITAEINKCCAPKDAARIQIAVTEWGTLFHILPSSSVVDHCKTLGSALYTASVLKALVECPKVEVANHFALIDPLFIGMLGLRDGVHVPNTPYYAFQMYTKHFGDTVVRNETTSPTYDSQAVGYVPRTKGVPYVETVASTGDGGQTLRIILINKHFDRDANVKLDLGGYGVTENAETWTLGGKSIDANTGAKAPPFAGLNWAAQLEDDQNPRFSKGGPGEIWFREGHLSGIESSPKILVPAHSAMCVIFHRKG